MALDVVPFAHSARGHLRQRQAILRQNGPDGGILLGHLLVPCASSASADVARPLFDHDSTLMQPDCISGEARCVFRPGCRAKLPQTLSRSRRTCYLRFRVGPLYSAFVLSVMFFLQAYQARVDALGFELRRS